MKGFTMNNRSIHKTSIITKTSCNFLIPLSIKKIAKLYKQGMSENALSKQFNVSRSTIRNRLLSTNIHIRTQSEAETIKWANMNLIARANQVRAAHKARIGQQVSWTTKCKRAKTIEKHPPNNSPYEIKLAKMLLKRGIKTIPQKAIGGYNCDLAAYPVAVEVFAGKWHWYGNHIAITEKRFRYILNSGWFIYVVAINNSFPLTDAVAHHLASYIQSIRRDKPIRCQYRVVWGANEFITKGSLKDKHISIIPPFTNTRDSTTGRYKRIRR